MLISGNLLGDDSLVGSQINLNTNLTLGQSALGKEVEVSAYQLKPGTEFSVSLYSQPVRLISAVVDGSGAVTLKAKIPLELEPGNHRIIVTGIDSLGKPIEAVAGFRVDASGTVLAYSPGAQVSMPLSQIQSQIDRALNAGKPLFDVKLHPGLIATVALAVASLLGTMGIGGLSSSNGFGGSSSSQSSPKQKSSQGKLASVVTKKLKAVKTEKEARGDSSKTWKLPGTMIFDRLVIDSTTKSGKYTALLPRVLVDGTWARAMFGSGALVLWLTGLVIGIFSSHSVSYQPLPPALSLLLIIVALGILDSAIGAIAWLTMALISLSTGHIHTLADVRTLLGMFVLFSSLPLLAHAIRPLRRVTDGSFMQRFDRVADYVMPPIFVAFAASSMFKALNGLSGLQLVNSNQFGKLRITVIVFFLLRMFLEDFSHHFYPKRTIAAQPAKLSSQSKVASWIAIFSKLGIFLLISAPFFGLGIYTLLALALTAFGLIAKLHEDQIPNFVWINKWYPRGVARFLLLLVVGIYVGAAVLGDHPSATQIRNTYAIILLPGLIAGILEIVGREGWEWPERWFKRWVGSIVWLTALGIVAGFIHIK